MVETNLAPLAAATAVSGGQAAATESKMSAANKVFLWINKDFDEEY